MPVEDKKESLAQVTQWIQRASLACVVALVPEEAQYTLAQACIATRTPLVTASYVSPRIRELDQKAKDAGIPLLFECGLDLGIDYMGAMAMIDAIKASGPCTFRRFSSVCGGLPAPEAADNPIGYKFTWSPSGALRALQRPAQYKEGGKIVSIPGNKLLGHAADVGVIPALALEQLPNGNALPYAELYGMPHVPSIFRGTFRYRGFSAIMKECVALGLADDTAISSGTTTWLQLLAHAKTAKKIILSSATEDFFNWLGDASIQGAKTHLQAFGRILEEKLVLQPHERDLVVMVHLIEIERPNGSTEVHTASLLGYGDKDLTFMSRSVGLAAGIVVQLVLRGDMSRTGILAPTTPDIYKPALAALEAEGIVFKERVTRQPPPLAKL
ncbi:hypothetical protein LEN26_015337 [Aphanomyces euteiches]|nr:hypothetical protein LEN26_015337 [Aphanomyces euteiches]